ncbi:hypothetical protein E4656_00940 [Natronospirillum operosum]|uniref:DUF2391 family protein n=1 Tax=Natronospirillum operosum TaxID=2759953 RepID=A0A4Z0WB87_9GAMM|nr:hypothetical protein [Natronospirillum operosum]TGG95024.1 hypothetical protein E4656_00940 [Natronospirillum operosum]
MAINHVGRAGRLMLWISPVFIVPGVIVALLPWLEQQNDAIVQGVTTATAIFVLGYSLFIASRVNRRLDEVEVAGQRVASTIGMTIGMVAAVLVMLFPPR